MAAGRGALLSIYEPGCGFDTHQISVMNMICIGVRSQSGVGGLPSSVTLFRAALTFAQNIAMSNRVRQTPDTERNLGISKPNAPEISNTPVT